MILNLLLLISSILTGSVISHIVSIILVYQKGINLFDSLFSKNIPGFSMATAQAKSLDIIETVLTFVISLLLFYILVFFYKKIKFQRTQELFIGLSYLFFSFILTITTNFVHYSGTQSLIFITIWYLAITILAKFLPKKISNLESGKVSFMNGVLSGFYLMIVSERYLSSPVLPISILITFPMIFYLFVEKFRILKNPAFLILVLTVFFPFNKIALQTIGLTFIATLLILEKYFAKIRDHIPKNIYYSVILFLVLYNPLFYFGNFDPIEEGFWAGWLQRLLANQVIYKDFAAYHPPLLLIGLLSFIKIVGVNLYNLRLYFHLLQILGLIIIFFILQGVTRSTWILVSIFVLILSFSMGATRNNMEIRLATGLVPLFFVYSFDKTRKIKFLLLAGIFSGLAALVSLETGVASLVAILISVFLVSHGKNIITNLISTVTGILSVISTFTIYLLISGSLNKFLEYIPYYALTFASGFENFPIDRPIPQTIIQWNLVNQFIQSSGFLFAISMLLTISTLGVLTLKFVKKEIEINDILAAGIAVFTTVLMRSALGRSDLQHISFVLVCSLILTGYLLEMVSNISKVTAIIIISVLILFIASNPIQNILLQNMFVKFQTYGNPSGSYPSYNSPREKIIANVDADTKNIDDLINFIDTNTTTNDSIFVFPQEPEIYLLTNRKNATSFDTPETFFTQKYQDLMISELNINKPKFLIYYGKFDYKNKGDNSLNNLDNFIKNNYSIVKQFGQNTVLGK